MSAPTPVTGEAANSGEGVDAAPEERLLATCWSSAGDAASDQPIPHLGDGDGTVLGQ